jgi:LemA protein
MDIETMSDFCYTVGTMKKILLIVLVLAVIVGGWLWGAYNNFVTSRESLAGQWAQVESQYQRRLDLIPNLVESVRGMMKQEQKIFDDIAQARTQYGTAGTIDAKAIAASNMEGALSRLLVVMENYPALRSVENVLALMSQLEGTENRIAVERMRYNEAVRDYNLMTKRFPARMIAAMFGFAEHSYFEAAEEAKTAPKVELSQ